MKHSTRQVPRLYSSAVLAFVCAAFAPVAGATVLLSERFSDSDLSAWTVVDEGHLNGPSSWNKVGGRLTQRSNIWGGSNDANAIAKPGSYLVFGTGDSWRDYALKVRFRSDDDDALGVMFRVTGNDYYRFSWDRSREYRRLVKHIDGEFSLLAEDRAAYERNRDYILEIVVVESSLEIKIDGQAIFSVDDDALATGSVALYTWSNRATYFDDLQVTAIGDWYPAPASQASSGDLVEPVIVDNSDALRGIEVAPALVEASAKPLPGNLARWHAFSAPRTALGEPQVSGTLDQLDRVLLVAKLAGIGIAADYVVTSEDDWRSAADYWAALEYP